MSNAVFLANGIIEGSMIIDSIYRWSYFYQTGKLSTKSLVFDASTPSAATTLDFFNITAFSVGLASLFIYFKRVNRDGAIMLALGSLVYHTLATVLIVVKNIVYKVGPVASQSPLFGFFDKQLEEFGDLTVGTGIFGASIHGVLFIWFCMYIFFPPASVKYSSPKKMKTA